MARPRKPGARYRCGKLKSARVAKTERGDCVYVLSVFGRRVVKIGRSSDPGVRCREIQTSCDRLVRVFWAVRMSRDDSIRVEARVHELLRGTVNHERGEWYMLSERSAARFIEKVIEEMGVRAWEDERFGVNRDDSLQPVIPELEEV